MERGLRLPYRRGNFTPRIRIGFMEIRAWNNSGLSWDRPCCESIPTPASNNGAPHNGRLKESGV